MSAKPRKAVPSSVPARLPECSGSSGARISASIAPMIAARSENESPAVKSAIVLITKMRRAG